MSLTGPFKSTPRRKLVKTLDECCKFEQILSAAAREVSDNNMIQLSRDSGAACGTARFLLLLTLVMFWPCPSMARSPQAPDLSGLSAEERQSIEMACSYEKNVVGPAAYYTCLKKQLKSLVGVQRPDTSSLTSQERQSIEMACSYEKNVVGPAAYYACLKKQLSSLVGVQRPDTSSLTSQERQSIEMACSYEKNVVGPAAYYACVEAQLSRLQHFQQPQSSTPSATPAQRAALARLGYFLGTWTLLSSDGRFKVTQNNEWSADGLSIISTWEEERPSGTDSGRATYLLRPDGETYEYDGVNQDTELEKSIGVFADGTWTWSSDLGDFPDTKARFTIKELSPTRYSFKFEKTDSSGNWVLIREGNATKSK
jgi:hypothetical protein